MELLHDFLSLEFNIFVTGFCKMNWEKQRAIFFFFFWDWIGNLEC